MTRGNGDTWHVQLLSVTKTRSRRTYPDNERAGGDRGDPTWGVIGDEGVVWAGRSWVKMRVGFRRQGASDVVQHEAGGSDVDERLFFVVPFSYRRFYFGV